jgi:hypothetical protein
MNSPLKIFIGYDSKEPIAFSVLSSSILRRSSIPIAIIPLCMKNIESFYTRKRGPTESTEFSISRFLVPYISNYDGYSLFLDCDMLCRIDIKEILEEIDKQKEKSILVCKHDYTPSTKTKFLNQAQTVYPRKNWSSFIVFNNNLCKELSLNYVNSATGLDLHRFNWLNDDDIGEISVEWNWLVGEYKSNDKAKIIHYTLGGPWFKEYSNCNHSKEWFEELSLIQCENR